ncbi:hypothetical protein FA13DRAFT_151997 [Coprinellus micaceus]|uniref:Nephrocystin 3-like N-terminal domain-containing protein n=1 Tax=Coprinellus micaceus TaxID=71717 RepID=A0A4Y7TGW9_COPMI|nr:hypothetical protein FA13DRAFT_151997 [Coprinellus micaceus]
MAQSKDDQQEIVRLVREINFAIELSMLDVTIRGHTLTLQAVKGIHWLQSHGATEFQKIHESFSRVEKGVDQLTKAKSLKRLGAVKGFAFGAGYERGQCVAGSRIALLSQLLAWGEDEASIHAFWLNGPAGTGKTAISETLCSELSKRGLLGASFFCSVKTEDLSEVRHIIPTLAKALAEIHPRFGNALVAALDSEMRDPVWQMDVAEQYEFLILRPAREAFQNDHECIILCVDALDECRNKRALKEFLLAVISMPPPPFLKVFFTSRPESSLKDELDTPSCVALRQTLRLHEIKDTFVRADVGLFVHHELGRIQLLRDAYPGDQWPPPEVQVILERSGTFFIVAATIMRYIDDEAGDTVEGFREFHRLGGSVPSGVHSLYQRILQTAFGILKPKEKENALSCLSLLCCGPWDFAGPERQAQVRGATVWLIHRNQTLASKPT